MSKSVLIIDTPKNCFECPCFMEMGWRCQCRLDIDEEVHDGTPDWCPLKEEAKAIPIEWLKRWHEKGVANERFYEYELEVLGTMISEWEKENDYRH